MEMWTRIFFILLLLSLSDAAKNKTYAPEGEIRDFLLEFEEENAHLYNHLFANYHKQLSPIYVMFHNPNRTRINIPSFRINFTLMNSRLLDVDEAGQVMSIIVEFEVGWIDPRLMWDPANFSGIDNIVVPESVIWFPDFVFYDQATEAVNLIADNMRHVRINHTGRVSYPSVNLVKTVCMLDISEFPFDIQHCTVSLGTFVYSAKEISYRITIPYFEKDRSMTFGWHGNGEWQVNNVSARKIKENNNYVKYEYITIFFELQRHPSFFVTVIIMPCFLLNVLCIFGMFIDRSEDTLNKMILGLTALMAMTVELEIIAEEMPKTETLPLLADFVVICILIVAFASVTVIFLPKIHIMRKSLEHAQLKKYFRPNIIFLILFETCNVWNLARLLSYKKD